MLAEKLVIPRRAFFSLYAIFIAHTHKQFAVCQQALQLAAQRATALRKIFYQQVGQGINGGFNAKLLVLAAKFVDQKNQATGTGHEFFVICAFTPGDGFFMHFARQYTRLEQFVGRVKIKIVSRDNMPQGFIQVGLNNLVDHAELVAELAFGASLIQNPKCVFPKTATHGQNGIVL